VEPLVAETCRALLPLVTRGRIPTWAGAHASGGRVELRAVMQGEADPRRRHRVWQRKTLPVRRDPVVHLLLDLSGSMAGNRIDTAFAGVVLLCEVLHRLQIPFAVSGFQDRRIPGKAAADPLDPVTRDRLGSLPLEVVGRRPGGCNRPQQNHDGPALLDAAHELLRHPGQEHWLWVVSDGLPTGPGDGEGALRAAVQRVVDDGRIRLVGLGLGPGTEHVAAFFPDALPATPLEELPAALGGLVRRLVARSL
jgi:cobaltochelatase CobT